MQEVRDKLTEISGMRDVIAKDLWDGNASAHAHMRPAMSSPGPISSFCATALPRRAAHALSNSWSLPRAQSAECRQKITAIPADQISETQDIYVTDPPYGDAVKYEEILEFFIAWLRKNPSPEFAGWIWDSRRSLAIKGIDGRDMTAEAIHPRVKGATTFVDGLIAFAVDTANQCLVPPGIAKARWDGLSGAEWLLPQARGPRSQGPQDTR
jgi:hypothetical protein